MTGDKYDAKARELVGVVLGLSSRWGSGSDQDELSAMFAAALREAAAEAESERDGYVTELLAQRENEHNVMADLLRTRAKLGEALADIRIAREHEREACANIADDMASTAFQCRRLDPGKYEVLQQAGQALSEAARVIRKRGEHE